MPNGPWLPHPDTFPAPDCPATRYLPLVTNKFIVRNSLSRSITVGIQSRPCMGDDQRLGIESGWQPTAQKVRVAMSDYPGQGGEQDAVQPPPGQPYPQSAPTQFNPRVNPPPWQDQQYGQQQQYGQPQQPYGQQQYGQPQ